jgi:hypothetical protein
VDETPQPQPLQPQHRLPELEAQVLARLMKNRFGILSEDFEGDPPKFRLIGPPYDPTDPMCRSIVVPTHNLGGYRVSPLVLRQIINKFELDISEFMDGVEHPDVAVLRPKK